MFLVLEILEFNNYTSKFFMLYPTNKFEAEPCGEGIIVWLQKKKGIIVLYCMVEMLDDNDIQIII